MISGAIRLISAAGMFVRNTPKVFFQAGTPGLRGLAADAFTPVFVRAANPEVVAAGAMGIKRTVCDAVRTALGGRAIPMIK